MIILQGITAYPINEDNIFLWEAKINGLKETMWEGKCVKLLTRLKSMIFKH